MKNHIFILLVSFLGIAMSAQTSSQTIKEVNLDNGIAIQGYDPVAYFESNKAIEGKKEVAFDYNGAIYYFSSETNKALFVKNPEQYLPQYGGFCAYGLSEGHKAPITPQAFTVVNNKLYLNYNLNVRKMWSKEQAVRIEKATQNWDKIKKD